MNDFVYFFDSYAIIEIFNGNKNYEKYTHSIIFITKQNLFEVYYAFLRLKKEKIANYFLEKFYPFTIEFDSNDIIDAAKLKLKYKNRKLSMTDCLGYVIAKNRSIKFLTGDKEFIDFDNVEFVK
jgi:predicted nucleic acid-binding protein